MLVHLPDRNGPLLLVIGSWPVSLCLLLNLGPFNLLVVSVEKYRTVVGS